MSKLPSAINLNKCLYNTILLFEVAKKVFLTIGILNTSTIIRT